MLDVSSGDTFLRAADVAANCSNCLTSAPIHDEFRALDATGDLSHALGFPVSGSYPEVREW